MAILTATDLQHYLKVPNGQLDDDLAGIAVSGAQQAVLDYLDQQIEETEVELYLSAAGYQYRLILPNHPVTEIVECSESADTSNPRTIDPDTIVIDPDTDNTIWQTPKTNWQRGCDNIKIKYKYGYDGYTIPPTVFVVALQVAGRIYEGGPYSSDNTGGINATLLSGAGQLTDTEKDALEPHRRRL
jgi:hypothetical protein